MHYQVKLPGGKLINFPVGTALAEAAESAEEYYSAPIVSARVNNHLKELTFSPQKNMLVELIDLTEKEGIDIYRRSLTFLLLAAVKEIFPNSRLMVEHSLGKGLYCELANDGQCLTKSGVTAIAEKMRELAEKNIPIKKQTVNIKDAINIFTEQGQMEKVKLLRYRKKDFLNIYSCRSYQDYLFGYLVPSTGYLTQFALKFYMPGIILLFPDQASPLKLPAYIEQPKLFEVFREAENWCEILGVDTLGTLNDKLEAGEGDEFIRIAEALHEKRIAQLADQITADRKYIRLILIAGPSSSGKTTFAQRLRIQLLVNGLRPLPISLDNYFFDREHSPRDENGDYDFEALEALDLELFNEHLIALINGETVELPTYNFHTGHREYNSNRVKLNTDQPLIVEGIHGLNEKLTESIPQGQKFKIYISALTSLNLDCHNRIHTTDTRLLRRIVRDNQFRGYDAAFTLKQWPSVRRGEEKYIFPFQEQADTMFNSALFYELSVLKKFASPLLNNISADTPEFAEAQRLLKFLNYFLSLSPNSVPSNSILREFVGESCFI